MLFQIVVIRKDCLVLLWCLQNMFLIPGSCTCDLMSWCWILMIKRDPYFLRCWQKKVMMWWWWCAVLPNDYFTRRSWLTPLLMLVSYFLHFPVQRLLASFIDITCLVESSSSCCCCCCCSSNSFLPSGMLQCQFSSSSTLLFTMIMNMNMTTTAYFCSFFMFYCSISRSCIMNDASFTFLLVGRAKTDVMFTFRNLSSVTPKSRLVLQCQCQ